MTCASFSVMRLGRLSSLLLLPDGILTNTLGAPIHIQ